VTTSAPRTLRALGGPAALERLLAEAEPLGRRADGGWDRPGFGPEEEALRALVVRQVEASGGRATLDRATNLWGWFTPPGPGALVLGSHLDSVPGGGPLDGPLGVFSALAAVGELLGRGWHPRRPLAIVAFRDEEGSRFGRACLGSRLLAGELSKADLAALRDAAGTSLQDLVAATGGDPDAVGPDPEALATIGTFLELHVEQGRALVHHRAPLGIARTIWPHARLRVELPGQANHAGTTPMHERSDPVVALARLVLAARSEAFARGAHATIGSIHVTPNATNAIARFVEAWVDVRAATEGALEALLEHVATVARRLDGSATVVSRTPTTTFDPALAEQLAQLLSAPMIPTAAGHDAGILQHHGVRAGMLFVRNPTGISHAPEETASVEDRAVGVDALVRVIEELG
jgi:N-carbamoyl-L-amino-acid hydrolase